MPPQAKYYKVLKRGLDLLIAAPALMVLLPLFAVIAAVIKLTSPGPVFYRGIRAGREGKPFRIFKFRSMVADAESRGGPTTGTFDPRVTPWGAFLRRYKLDELPQLLNVLKGEMSLVGPRPEVMAYVERYTPGEKIILSVPPGVTDLSSLEFIDLDDLVGREDPDRFFQEFILPRKNALRVEYVKNASLLLDILIMVRTLRKIARKLCGGKRPWKE
jgi:lipopolysaccharide/colanic/teichoic acid biosynthesis glycosyltransferase